MGHYKKIHLFYLGQQGGGARLTRDLFLELWESGQQVELWVKSNSETLELLPSQNMSINKINLPDKRAAKILKFPLTYLYLKKLFSELDRDSINIFIMPHPYNLGVIRRMNKKNSLTISIIHDHRAHSGELYPSYLSIVRIARKSNICVFLSKHVSDKVKSENKVVSILESIPLITKQNLVETDNKPYFLIAGRLRKYKNLEEILRKLENFPITIRIIGAGHFPKRLLKDTNFEIVNKWFNAFEFESEIKNCLALINFYTDATQSGPISIAKLYGKFIFTNGTGGIAEQLADYNRYKILTLDEFSNLSKIEIDNFLNQTKVIPSKETKIMDLTEKIIGLAQKR